MQNSQQHKNFAELIWHFLRPTPGLLLLYALVAIGILLGSAYSVQAGGGEFASNATAVAALFRDAFQTGSHFLNQSNGWSHFLLFAFWAGVSSLLYLLAWFVLNVAIDLYDDVVISAVFVHPRSFHQSSYWLAIMARGLMRITAGLLLIGYAVFWAVVCYPVWTTLSRVAVTSPLSLVGLKEILLTFVGVIISLHVCAVLMRFAVLKNVAREA